MEKMVYFARILAVEIRKVNEVFLENVPWHFSHFYDMFRLTKLRLEGNQFINLEDLWEDSELEDMEWKWYLNEDEGNLSNYADDDEDEKNLAGVLICDNFLYEVLYEYVILGQKFKEDKKNEAAKELLETIYKIAAAFQLELQFRGGRIYLWEKKQHLDDGSFICKTMAEVEAVCKFRKGASLMDAREFSGMSEDEWNAFSERLKRHEWKQTSACEE